MTLDIILHIVALSIGIILFRKTRIVRDHEWQRAQAVKSVSGHFKAEDKGVWESEIKMETTLSPEAEANLKGQVVTATGSNTISHEEIDTEVEVEMLIDTEHVRRAQARVSGNEQFDDDRISATIGAVRKPSPMDSFLDWVGGLFGRDTKSVRDAKRSEELRGRSREDPVLAQRPIAPLEPIETDRKRPQPMEMISMTDSGEESIVIEEETNLVTGMEISSTQSIEEMAFGLPVTSTTETSHQSINSPQPSCGACGFSNPIGDRFCSNCGTNL